MADPRILLLQCPPAPAEDLPDTLQRLVPEITTDICSHVAQALDRLDGCQAVVCWADARDELAAVVRVRNASPTVPILLVSERNQDEEFSSLAVKLGANSVLHDPKDEQSLAESIVVALRTVALSRRTLKQARQVHKVTKEVSQLAREANALAVKAREEVSLSARFAPLIVVARKPDAGVLKKALTKAQLASRLPIVCGVKEAMAYLEGRPPFGDRRRSPIPSLLILDFDLGREVCRDLVSWIRKSPAHRVLPVALMGRSLDATERAGMEAAGATWILEKGATASELAETLKEISLHWTLHNLGLDL